MIDNQPNSGSPRESIPVISPILHCLAMPVLVIMRRNFGYHYLRPKTIFLTGIACVWMLSYMVWQTPGLKARFLTLSMVGVLASCFYLLHLGMSITKVARMRAEHGRDSGESNLLAIVSLSKRERLQPVFHCLVEPAAVMFAGFLSPGPLGFVLKVCAASLFFKEAIRTWLGLLKNQMLRDKIKDAKDSVGSVATTGSTTLTSKGKTGREVYCRKVG